MILRKQLVAYFKIHALNFSMWTRPVKLHSDVKISASQSEVFEND